MITDVLHDYLQEVKQYPILSNDEILNLIEKYRFQNDKLAKDKVINSNLRIVVSLAHNFPQRGMSLADLVQEGNLGLIASIDKYDFSHDVKFITYAGEYIKGYIIRAIENKSRIIRIPVSMQNKLKKMNEFKGIYLSAYFVMNLGNLDDVNESIQNNCNSDPLELITLADKKNQINKAIDRLKASERYLLKKYFGLNDSEEKSLIEIADELGFTKQNISNYKRRALDKLKYNNKLRSL